MKISSSLKAAMRLLAASEIRIAAAGSIAEAGAGEGAASAVKGRMRIRADVMNFIFGVRNPKENPREIING